MSTPQVTPSASTFGMEYLDSLYRYALMLTRNPAEADDLVQETYLRAIQAFSRLREDSNVRAWLFTILRNLRLNAIRKVRTGPRLVQDDKDGDMMDDLTGNSPDPHELLEKGEDIQRVRFAIEELSPEFREILLLREFEELSYQEIATVLRCPIGTVMSRLGRARAKLRTVLTSGGARPLPSLKVGPI